MFLKTELKFNNEDDDPKIKIDFICKKRKKVYLTYSEINL